MSGPHWFDIAEGYIGVTEIPGKQHNGKIRSWLERLGAWWRDDETPWCGVFVAHCLREAGQPLPQHWMRALAWKDYGSNLRSTHVTIGAILVFQRKGGGHVGFYVGENATHYFVLGGNQANAVNISKIAKDRCVAIRWPKGVPVVGGPVRLSMNAEITTDEA